MLAGVRRLRPAVEAAMGDAAYETVANEEQPGEKKSKRPKPDKRSLSSQKSASTESFAREKYADEFQERWQATRDSVAAPPATDPFAGGANKRKSIGGKQPGEGGYGLRLHDAAQGAAHANADAAPIAVPATPVLSILQAAIQQQHHAAEELSASPEISAPKWNERNKQYTVEWTTENMTSLMRYEFEQTGACSAFNRWCGLANATNVALQDVIATARLMGFDLSDEKQTAAFVMSLETSVANANQLVDAKVLGRGRDQSWSTRSDDTSAKSEAKPELKGTEVGPRMEDVTEAYTKLQSAYAKVYEGMLRDRERASRSEAAVKRNQIARVDQVIHFWVSLGDTAMQAPKAMDGVATGAHAVEQKLSAARLDGSHSVKKAQEAAVRHEKHGGARNHIDAHKNSRDYEAQFDAHRQVAKERHAAAASGEPAAGVAPAPVMPSLSVSTILELGLKAHFSSRVDELNKKLTGIEAQANATAGAALFVSTHQAAKDYDTAAHQLESRLGTLSTHALQERQQDFMELGHELDRYAVEHAGALKTRGKGALVPGAGKEQHGTTMAVIAKIEQYRAVSAMALQTFNYDAFLIAARDQQLERSGMKRPRETTSRSYEKTNHRPPPLPAMSADEIAVYQHIGGTYLRVLEADERWRIRLKHVSSGTHALLKKLAGNDASPNTVGRRF
jgi:hypothetical protein